MTASLKALVINLLKEKSWRPTQPGRLADGNALVLDFHSDFAAIWGLDLNSLKDWRKEGEACPRVFLIWPAERAAVPSGTGLVDVLRYLTPFDWCVALAAAVGATSPVCEVIVLDQGSHHADDRGFVRLFRCLQEGPNGLIPWISRYGPANVGGLLKHLDKNRDVPAAQRSDVRALVEALRGELLRPSESRHSIANILGPRLLLGSAAPPGQDVVESALQTLLGSIGLLPEAGRVPTDQPDPRDPRGAFSARTSLTLIDDLCSHGWATFLEDAAPDNRTIRSRSDVTAPTFGMDENSRLEELLEEGPGSVTNLRALRGADERQVLCLDLRLFSGTSEKDEARFYKRLFLLARRRYEKRRWSKADVALSWPGIPREELLAIASYLRGPTRDHPGYFASLCLLPQLLALWNPSLPIILFSSTSRRSIVERLLPYGNIILDFEKPQYFTGEVEDVVRSTRAKLRQAMSRAEAILAAGRSLAALSVRVEGSR